MQTVIGGYAMGLSSMLYKRTQREIIDLFGVNNLSDDGALRIVMDAWKNGIITLLNFKVDTLFQNILRVLSEYRNNAGSKK